MRGLGRMLLLIGFFLCMQSQLFAQQTFRVFGAGTDKSCGDFVQNSRERTEDERLQYVGMLSWMYGVVTGAGEERSVSDFLWDQFVRGGLRAPAERTQLAEARGKYCQDNSSDPICAIWKDSPVRPARTGSVMKETNGNGLLTWIQRRCAEHPLETFANAVDQLLLELWRDTPDAPR